LGNNILSSQRNFSDPQQLQQRQTEASDNQELGAPQSTEQPPLAQMSELDRFGLAGLLRMIHSESPDVASLAVGQDLMTLGLDLNQAEYGNPFFQFQQSVLIFLDLYIRHLLHHLSHRRRQFLWNKTSLFQPATTLQISNLSSPEFPASATKRSSSSSTACLEISCRNS